MVTKEKLEILKDNVWHNFYSSDFNFSKINIYDFEYILKFIEVNRFKLKNKLAAIFNDEPDKYIKNLILISYNVWYYNTDFRFLNVLIKFKDLGILSSKFLSKKEKYLILKEIKNF